MPFYAGFDVKKFPGNAMMDWLSGPSNSNLSWCGYYLEPAPNRGPTGWTGQYDLLKAKWGTLPIYVGQQDLRTGNAHYTPSSILTADQGQTDAVDAANLAAADNFPLGTCVYLDWEYGGLDPYDSDHDSKAYITAWITAVVSDPRVKPGIYCSHAVAGQMSALLDTMNPTPLVRFWCWNVPTNDAHQFTGDLQNLPTPDPSGCGVTGATAWQREANAIVSFPADAPTESLQLDFSTSSLADPGAP